MILDQKPQETRKRRYVSYSLNTLKAVLGDYVRDYSRGLLREILGV